MTFEEMQDKSIRELEVLREEARTQLAEAQNDRAVLIANILSLQKLKSLVRGGTL